MKATRRAYSEFCYFGIFYKVAPTYSRLHDLPPLFVLSAFETKTSCHCRPAVRVADHKGSVRCSIRSCKSKFSLREKSKATKASPDSQFDYQKTVCLICHKQAQPVRERRRVNWSTEEGSCFKIIIIKKKGPKI